MKNKGFTLVELLAVIVILALILAIAVPGITGVVSVSTKNAFASDLKMIIKAIDYKKAEYDSFDPTTINEDNINSLLNLSNYNYKTLTVKEINDKIYVTIIGKNKWNNLTATGILTQAKVSDTITNFVRGANAPVLATGMTPIKWNGSAWVDTTENDAAWFNYDTINKTWANARTADGSMWVWIPRFTYKINTPNWHASTAGSISVQFTKGINDNWNKDIIGDIKLNGTAASSNSTWTNHPAFTFGDTELPGFWVGKFEASGTTVAVDFKPNVSSLRNLTTGSMFTATRNMETNSRYGWGATGNNIDTHMMKNSEWGAIAYLANSTYGKNAEIWMNNSSTFTTGCAGSSESPSPYAGCANAYNTANGMQASTTGNIYGIYDMSGGAWEYVSAYMDSGHSNLSNGSTIINADVKYRDVYKVDASESVTYDLTTYKKGDAVYETSIASGVTSWYSDYSFIPSYEHVWFQRGGSNDNGANSGAFCFGRFTGEINTYYSFRTVLMVGEGL